MEWYAEFTNSLREIPDVVRVIIMGILAIVICFCMIKFLNKNVGKLVVNMAFAALAVVCVTVIIFLMIYN